MYSVHFVKLQLLIFLLPHSYFIFPWNVLLEMLICSFSINKRKSKKKNKCFNLFETIHYGLVFKQKWLSSGWVNY